MKSLAEFCYSRRRLVLVGWIVLLVGLFALSGAFAGEYKTEFTLPGSESQAALDLLEEKGVSERTGFTGQVVFKADQGVNDSAVRQTITNFLQEIEGSVEGVETISPYDSANAHQISSDGKTAYAEVNFSDRSNEAYVEDAKIIKDDLKEIQASAPAGLQIELGGDLFIDEAEFSSEVLGIAAAMIILLLVFGSLLAMGLPIVTALFGIACGSAIIGLVANVLSVPEFTTAIAAMIGIGVGIDYALLVVTRYRAGLHNGLEPREAVALSIDTSGRSVLFAGITVVISLLGMFFLNLDFMRSMATGAVLAVLMTMLAALTLLPALLGFAGKTIDRFGLWDSAVILAIFIPLAIVGVLAFGAVESNLSIVGVVLAIPVTIVLFIKTPAHTWGISLRRKFTKEGADAERVAHAEGGTQSFWYRWSRVIQNNPWPALIGSIAILLILAFPVLSIRLGFADAGSRVETDTTRKAYDILAAGFGVGFNSPIVVIQETPNGSADSAAVNSLKTALTNTQGVASVNGPVALADGDLQLFNVVPDSAPQDEETTDLVHRLRKETIGADVISSQTFPALTTGGPAFVVDFSDYMSQKLPIFFGAVLLLSFLLLLVVFHSLIVPIKAVLMNMLSIGAAFGATVAVFQWGFLGEVIGVNTEGPIEAWAPMMLFAIVFGLSMDYEVFLLTRVREEYDRTGDNGLAVADGLAATGRVISAAALIMICVFGAFLFNPDRTFKLMGFGLSFAIFIDATVVRLVLVPAAMELMGNFNWWAPKWLVQYLPTIRVDNVEHPVPEAGGGGG